MFNAKSVCKPALIVVNREGSDASLPSFLLQQAKRRRTSTVSEILRKQRAATTTTSDLPCYSESAIPSKPPIPILVSSVGVFRNETQVTVRKGTLVTHS